MISDQEIASCVESLLRNSPDPAAASLPGVVHQLEAKLGLSLAHKTAFIRDQIDHLIGPRPPPSQLQPQPQSQPPPSQPLSNLQNPYLLHHHQFQQISRPPPSASSPTPSSSVAVATPSPFPQQNHPDYAYVYPPPPPLPAAAVVAAYHLQQQLQQTPQVAPAVVWPAAGASPKESASTGVKRRGGPGGLNKVCGVSPELQVIVGEATMPRTQIVKQLWAYIRKNNLQDPNNKRKIICNDELRRVFETDCTDMFKMNKLLAKHIIPLEPTKDTVQESKKLKSADVAATSDGGEHPLFISDALAKFFGSEEREILQSEATRRVLHYIKDKQLEDSGKASIICDSKLQELFGCESLPTAAVSDMLANHLYKSS